MESKPDGKPSDSTNDLQFCVELFGQIVDMREVAQEVIADYPHPVAITVENLARLCVIGHNGRPIKARDYPPGLDRGVADQLRSRCARWLYWLHKRTQLRDGGVFPKRQFQCGDDACTRARLENGTIIAASQQQRLPLNGCWDHYCTCDYALVQRDGTVI